MKQVLLTTCLPLMAACATPDVSPQVEASRTILTNVTEQITPQITPLANAERARVLEAAIQAGDPVLDLDGDCDTIASRESPSVLSDCILVERFDAADDPGSATEVLEFLQIMDTYLTSLEALVASDTPQEARAQANAIIAAFGTPDTARPAAFERLGAALRERQTLIGTATGFIVNQVRVSAIRRVATKADAEITLAIPVVAAHLAFLDEDLIDAQVALLDAEEAVLTLEGSGDVSAYRDALNRLRNSHKEFLRAEAASPIIKLYQFRQAHAELLARTTSGVTTAELVSLLEELRALRDAAEEEA